MAAIPPLVLRQIERSLRFEYQAGESTLVGFPHTTGWRVLPDLMVTQTNYSSTVEVATRETLTVAAGQAITIPPGLVHCITKTSRHAGYSNWAHVRYEIFPGVSLFSLVDISLRFSGKSANKIGEINSALAQLDKSEPTLAVLLQRQALGWELIATLFTTATFKEEGIELIRHASRLTPVLAWLNAHLAEPLTHDMLARKAGLSPSRFHVVFRSAFGCAPYAYLQRERLKKAQELLIRTDLPVAEIGRSVGHPDPYHFSRMFRRNAGVSPLTYRRQTAADSF